MFVDRDSDAESDKSVKVCGDGMGDEHILTSSLSPLLLYWIKVLSSQFISMMILLKSNA